MVTKAISARVSVKVDLSSISAGNWPGTWSGYTVKCNIQGEEAILEVDTGVRGIDIPCMVHVKHGTMSSIEVEAI